MIFLRCFVLTSLGWTFSNGFSLTGCYSTTPQEKDTMTLAYKADSRLTVSECSRKCQQNGKAYSGLLKASSCFCGDEFGLTPPMTDCNNTCSDSLSCGGMKSYSTYYVIDDSSDKRKYVLSPERKTFYESRKKCIKLGGDLFGRSEQTEKEQISQAVRNSGAKVSEIWIGLRRRDAEYEWVDEKDPNQGDTYAKEKYLLANRWRPNDLQMKCVSYDVDSGSFASNNCSDHLLPFLCYLPLFTTDPETSSSQPSSNLRNSTDPEENSRSTALLIVLPLFFICYGGACILYCTNQVIKHCCSKGHKHSKLRTSRPSSAKKSKVHPETAMINQSNKVPPLVPFPDKTPFEANPQMDEKKAKLLENASREALERRMKDTDEGKASRIFSGQKNRQPPSLAQQQQPPADRPESGSSTGNLLPPPASSMSAKPPEEDQEPAQSMAGKSINEILRLKMAQQANKKRPNKILAA